MIAMKFNPEIILLHGKNCSGKSTVAAEAASLGKEKGLSVAHIPLGDILRAIASSKADSQHSRGLQADLSQLATYQPAKTHDAMGVFKE